MKKILVIGSMGFIGSAAVRYYESQGYAVSGCDLIENDKVIDYHKVERNEPDYTRVFQQVSPDYCLNASGAANVPLSFDDPLMDYQLMAKKIKINPTITTST